MMLSRISPVPQLLVVSANSLNHDCWEEGEIFGVNPAPCGVPGD
jgi:hypothetical protein